MAAKEGLAPIIVKRKKVVEGGHHGGAWKVAYADFVTAMMAFFLLMWLLNATTEDQRKGIADYFDPKVPISKVSAGGNGLFQGTDIFAQERLARTGTGGSGLEEMRGDAPQPRLQSSPSTQGPDEAEIERQSFEAAKAAIIEQVGALDPSGTLARHLQFTLTEQGLRIDIRDDNGASLFASGSAEVSPRLELLLRVVAGAVAPLGNRIAVSGHTDATPYRGSGYTNWELSSDRAHTARRVLATAGLGEDRVARVEGRADLDPLDGLDPRAPQNRRIAVLLLSNQ